jgi:hypothetical protein
MQPRDHDGSATREPRRPVGGCIRPPDAQQSAVEMAARPRPTLVESDEPPIDDPLAVQRAFRRHRRRRLARLEYRREVALARRRFWMLVGALFVLAAFLSVTIWEQIQSMFGL